MKTGIDVVKVSRFSNLKKLGVYFTENELEYANKFKNFQERLAGLFAVKEAILKAFGIGIRKRQYLTEIEITHTLVGEPTATLSGEMKQLFDENKFSSIQISISHSSDIATAICIII